MDRPVAGVRRELVARARERRNLRQTDPEEAVRLVESLGGTGLEGWASTLGATARAPERRAGEAATPGDEPGERREIALAYGYRRVAR